MHGNTKTAENSSLKTRAFSDIVHEITRSMKIHAEQGTILGGVHLELTGEVNEEGFSVVSDRTFILTTHKQDVDISSFPPVA